MMGNISRQALFRCAYPERGRPARIVAGKMPALRIGLVRVPWDRKDQRTLIATYLRQYFIISADERRLSVPNSTRRRCASEWPSGGVRGTSGLKNVTFSRFDAQKNIGDKPSLERIRAKKWRNSRENEGAGHSRSKKMAFRSGKAAGKNSRNAEIAEKTKGFRIREKDGRKHYLENDRMILIKNAIIA
jgi:hypothetical protein